MAAGDRASSLQQPPPGRKPPHISITEGALMGPRPENTPPVGRGEGGGQRCARGGRPRGRKRRRLLARPRPGAVVRRDTGAAVHGGPAPRGPRTTGAPLRRTLPVASSGLCPPLFLPPPGPGLAARAGRRGEARPRGLRGLPAGLRGPLAGREGRRGSPQQPRSGPRRRNGSKRAFSKLSCCRYFTRRFLPRPSPSGCLLALFVWGFALFVGFAHNNSPVFIFMYIFFPLSGIVKIL